jgi:hypothetical protein
VRVGRRPLVLLLLAGLTCSGPAVAAEFIAGGYSFSDELGGFRLLSASGSGTPDDPIVLVEEIAEAAPVTLVIRRMDGETTPGVRHTQLTLEKTVVNRSERVWGGFEMALQEILKRPSSYADGLSFNQYGAKAPDVRSDSFSDNNRIFEPDDRIRFERGHVDPDGTARFRITVTDPTPVREFFLVQDPQLLSASLPGPTYAVRRGQGGHCVETSAAGPVCRSSGKYWQTQVSVSVRSFRPR